jgi:hypothetical protein
MTRANDISNLGNVASTLVSTGSSLGIGTAAPASALQVVGGITADTISVGGSFTAYDTRMQSVSEQITIVNGNNINLVYNANSGNVAICTNPTGPITLNITGIPVDSTFNNRSITFTVVVIQTSIGYACTAVTLNGVSKTIKYPGSIVSVASTNSYDIFNFTGINTVGSASTTANYQILSILNGNFK